MTIFSNNTLSLQDRLDIIRRQTNLTAISTPNDIIYLMLEAADDLAREYFTREIQQEIIRVEQLTIIVNGQTQTVNHAITRDSFVTTTMMQIADQFATIWLLLPILNFANLSVVNNRREFYQQLIQAHSNSLDFQRQTTIRQSKPNRAGTFS